MKLSMLLVLLLVVPVYAQQPPSPQSPEVQQLEAQMQSLGCSAERQTAAQTIVGLQKQISALQDQLKKADPPPKSGATKK